VIVALVITAFSFLGYLYISNGPKQKHHRHH
jgi:hypothetical protein